MPFLRIVALNQLEVELRAQLHGSALASGRYRLGGEDFTQCSDKAGSVFRTAEIGWVRKICVVESVIGFEAQLEVARLVDVDSLLQRHVAVVDSRAIEWVAAGRAELSRSRKRERCRIEPKLARIASRVGDAQGSTGAGGAVGTSVERDIKVARERCPGEIKNRNRQAVLQRVNTTQAPIVGQRLPAMRELVEGQR